MALKLAEGSGDVLWYELPGSDKKSSHKKGLAAPVARLIKQLSRQLQS